MHAMLTEGLTLMIAGMGTVIVFLSLMVIVMQATGTFFKKYGDRFREPAAPISRVEQVAGDETDAIAVAVAALKAYLRK